MYCLRPDIAKSDRRQKRPWSGVLILGPVMFLLSSCAAGPQQKTEKTQLNEIAPRAGQPLAPPSITVARGDVDDRVTLSEIAAVAQKVDRGYEDGWICGREPRVFKSPYGKLDAEHKAAFALAYHNFMEGFPQDLANDRSTYVPYSKRSAFSRSYWESSDLAEKFKKEPEKYQVAWIHESLLDGSELWWRAAEIRFGGRINSASTLSHDTEQNMVFKYMEDQNTESTFALQLKPKK